MSDTKPCDSPVVPWDEQQGYRPREHGDVGCGNCGVALRLHAAGWTRGEKQPSLNERLRPLVLSFKRYHEIEGAISGHPHEWEKCSRAWCVDARAMLALLDEAEAEGA